MSHTQQPFTFADMRARLVEELGINLLSKEEQDVIISELSDVLNERATLLIGEKMEVADLDTVDRLLEEGKQQEALDLMLQKVPDAADIYRKTLADGIREYRLLTAEADQRLKKSGEDTQ